MWNVKNGTNELIYTKDTDVGNNLIITRVEEEEEYQHIHTTIFKVDKKGPTI